MRELDIKTVLDIPRWQKIQDRLAETTGTAILSVDYKGIPVTKHSCRTEFCSVIRENAVSRKRCYRCDALAGLEAVRLERPYIYLCHCDIIDVAVPVIVGDKYLGAVMFGQVRLHNKDKDKAVRLINEISSFQSEEETARTELMEMYERLPEMEYSRIVEIAQLISSVVEYFVGKAVEIRDMQQTYQWLIRSSGDAGVEMQELNEAVIPQMDEVMEPDSSPIMPSSPIYPAVEYIKKHPGEKITMAQMASLCRISASYFSRLFTSQVGETFTSFVNRQAVNCAKRYLRETDKSVTQIAGELGYTDPSTFIRHFKRFEGVTPQVYRRYGYK